MKPEIVSVEVVKLANDGQKIVAAEASETRTTGDSII